MDCEQALEAISAALDGELSRAEQVELEAHLSACPQCRALAEDLRAVTAALEETEAAPPPGLSARVMERVAAEGKVVPISAARRSGWRRWAGLAAMLALVACVGGLGLWLRNGGASTGNASSPAAGYYSAIGAAPSGGSAPRAAEPSCSVESSVGPSSDSADSPANNVGSSANSAPEDADQDGTPNAGPDGQSEAPMEPGARPAPTAVWPEPENYFFQNQQNVKVTWGATPDAPSARVLGSVDSLEEFAAQFPENDLTQLVETYNAEYFAENRLLAVVVEEGSGSISHTIAPQGLYRDEVEIVRIVPEVGTCDMAAWIIFAEVDAMFDDGDVLAVVFGD